MNKFVLIGTLFAVQSSFGSLILTSPIAVSGTGLGTEPTLLTIQSQGSSSTEAGCVGSTSTQIGTSFNASGVCTGASGDVLTGTSQIGPQTLAAAGITTASTFGIVFNAAEPGGDSITLTGLTASFYSSTGTFLYQTSGFSCAGLGATCTFPSTATGTGKSGFLFSLDTAQQAAATAAGAFSSSSNLVGLSASASSATGGNETFYLANISGSGGGGGGGQVPEPGTMMLTGGVLVGLGSFLKRKVVRS